MSFYLECILHITNIWTFVSEIYSNLFAQFCLKFPETWGQGISQLQELIYALLLEG